MKFVALAALACLLPAAALAASDDAVRSPAFSGETRVLSNGSKIVTKGSEVTVLTAGGQKIIMNRSDPEFAHQTPPIAKAASCANWAQTIQLAPTLNRAWRRAVANYARYC